MQEPHPAAQPPPSLSPHPDDDRACTQALLETCQRQLQQAEREKAAADAAYDTRVRQLHASIAGLRQKLGLAQAPAQHEMGQQHHQQVPQQGDPAAVVARGPDGSPSCGPPGLPPGGAAGNAPAPQAPYHLAMLQPQHQKYALSQQQQQQQQYYAQQQQQYHNRQQPPMQLEQHYYTQYPPPPLPQQREQQPRGPAHPPAYPTTSSSRAPLSIGAADYRPKGRGAPAAAAASGALVAEQSAAVAAALERPVVAPAVVHFVDSPHITTATTAAQQQQEQQMQPPGDRPAPVAPAAAASTHAPASGALPSSAARRPPPGFDGPTPSVAPRGSGSDPAGDAANRPAMQQVGLWEGHSLHQRPRQDTIAAITMSLARLPPLQSPMAFFPMPGGKQNPQQVNRQKLQQQQLQQQCVETDHERRRRQLSPERWLHDKYDEPEQVGGDVEMEAAPAAAAAEAEAAADGELLPPPPGMQQRPRSSSMGTPPVAAAASASASATAGAGGAQRADEPVPPPLPPPAQPRKAARAAAARDSGSSAASSRAAADAQGEGYDALLAGSYQQYVEERQQPAPVWGEPAKVEQVGGPNHIMLVVCLLDFRATHLRMRCAVLRCRSFHL